MESGRRRLKAAAVDRKAAATKHRGPASRAAALLELAFRRLPRPPGPAARHVCCPARRTRVGTGTAATKRRWSTRTVARAWRSRRPASSTRAGVTRVFRDKAAGPAQALWWPESAPTLKRPPSHHRHRLHLRHRPHGRGLRRRRLQRL